MTKISIFTFFVFLLLQNNLKAQGCTDPQANNFDASAIDNDGSCEYNTTTYTLTQKAILSDVVVESSGLVFFDNQLWTHNDGGNPDKIYQIDTLTGEVIKTVIIVYSDNEDWEDITQDETHLYIGDFGNNNGNRSNLRVYKILKSELASGVANPELIQFSYADQTDFTPANNNNDYDCEAFFFYNDSLHLFTKNWIDNKTKHYVIPSSSGTYVANIRETLDVQGLVTGADI
ncbi:MAG TPA: T9SS C-terminal target domain-containing protein, partial [Phaeodactylibacter sp.]|nr:T9SS C-terminal target domain-containing protein [Phaeodactylibacter sp.]